MAENETKTESASKAGQIRCPVCLRTVFNNFTLTDMAGEKAGWYMCFCGCKFHAEPPYPPEKIYTQKFRNEYRDGKRQKERQEYIIRLYAPMVEELTWGRKHLDVGLVYPYLLDSMQERGWVSRGTSRCSQDGDRPDIEICNPEDKKPDTERWDLITMIDVLQTFENPVGELHKAYKMMQAGGCLLVITPDADQLDLVGWHGWGHWNRREHRCYWSGRMFLDVVKRLGFDVVAFWRNVNLKFTASRTFHCLLQKPLIRLDWNEIHKEVDTVQGANG